MAKIAIQDITDAGFRPEQFGTPGDFAVAGTGYLARLIDDAAMWCSGAVGDAAYAAATGIGALRLKKAELCYCKAELWRRRAAFLDANAMSALGEAVSRERLAYLKHADEAQAGAVFWIDEFKTAGQADRLGGGLTMGHVESGPYAGSGA